MSAYPQEGSASVVIAATPDVVWDLVSDITRMGQWSPECVRAEWTDGAAGPASGARFHGYNRMGTVEWDEPCEVTECEPGAVFAFKVPRDWPDATHWRYELTAADGATTLTESFVAPLINVEGSPANHEGRCGMLIDGMRQTLDRIKAAAEAQ
jgi:uncharacterized protein YndB with AHSA1/START domain